MYEMVHATLVYQIYYFDLFDEQNLVVDDGKRIKITNFNQDDQLQAVRKIFHVISVEPLVAFFTRLTSPFHPLMQCKPRRNKILTVFVPRFRSLAEDHLMHVSVSTKSQLREILAITLLTNAILSVERPAIVMLQIVAIPGSSKHRISEDGVTVSWDAHRKMSEMLDKLSRHTSSDEALPQPTYNANTVRHKALEMRKWIEEILTPNTELVQCSNQSQRVSTMQTIFLAHLLVSNNTFMMQSNSSRIFPSRPRKKTK